MITEKLSNDLITVIVDDSNSQSITIEDHSSSIEVVISQVGDKGDKGEKGDAGLTPDEVLDLVHGVINNKLTDAFGDPIQG